jgi:hypothetical protein
MKLHEMMSAANVATSQFFCRIFVYSVEMGLVCYKKVISNIMELVTL